jgi:hypothetical protein
MIACGLLNILVSRIGEARLNRLVEAEGMPHWIVQHGEVVESITDLETAQRIQLRLLAMRRPPSRPLVMNVQLRQVQQRLNEWAFTGRDWLNADILEIPDVDGHQSDDRFRGALDHRRRPQLASQLTA